MIDILNFSKALAGKIYLATGVETLTEGDNSVHGGEFSDLIILAHGGNNEAVAGNSTYSTEYRLSYVYQPETMEETAATEKQAQIFQNIADYINGISRYSELGGAVILDAQVKPYEINYNGAAIQYIIPLSFVLQF